MDSGANMFVAHKRKYLHRFVRKKIAVELAIGVKGHFDGVGIMLASSPNAPGFMFMCYPTFLATNDKCCTVTNGAFMKFAKFKRVLLDTWRAAHFLHHSGAKFSLPFTTVNSIDYISLQIHTTTPSSRRAEQHQQLQCQSLALQPVAVNHPTMKSSWAQTWSLHICYGHRSVNSLQSMIDKGYITGRGIPEKLAPLPFRCPICDAAGATKLRRGPLVDTSKLPIGVLWHLDFTFFNEVSIRGLTSALVIVEATERYVFFFPCRHKNPPVDLCLYFFSWIRRHGLPVVNIRCDEDGAFIRSTEFCRMMLKSLGVAIQSTGGYASSINGKAEAPHRTIKTTTRSMLMGADMSDEYWCFAGQYAANVHNNCVNRMTGRPPALGYAKRLVPVSQIFPFGSRVKIIKDLKSKRALGARTSGDPRSPLGANIYPPEVGALASPSAFDALFLGWSSNPSVSLLLKLGDTSNRILRGHHIIVDPFGISHDSQRDKLRPNEVIYQRYYDLKDQKCDPSAPGIEWSVDMNKSSLDTVQTLFDANECEAFDVTLPPKGQSIGITLMTDEDYLAPILVRIEPDASIYSEIAPRHHFCKS